VVHLQESGFEVDVKDVSNAELMNIKQANGISPELQGCHTALVDGYVIEGHVPADLIARLLEERPAVQGLTVPGMPVGSPGMESTYSEPYDVLTFDSRGETSVYASR
jgi:hypothetical protein